MTVPYAVLLPPDVRAQVLPADVLAPISDLGHEVAPSAPAARIVITGWGTPSLTDEALDRRPELALVAHAAGSVRGLLGRGFWERGIQVTSAAAANAVPVAEFTVAQVVLALKSYWRTSLLSVRGKPAPPDAQRRVPGTRGALVGLVGLGFIASLVAERLKKMGVEVIAYDPHVSAARAALLGVRLVDLPTVFAHGEVVSIHAPLYEATVGLVREQHLGLLRPDATLINTARARVIEGGALLRVLSNRPDVVALLDVTDPEPLPAGHPLLELDNVVVSPHIAGSLGRETAAMGELVVGEIRRFLTGAPLQHAVTRSASEVSA